MSDPLLEQIYEAGVKDERKKWEERIEQMVADIEFRRTRIIQSRDYKLALDDVMDIIHKYTKEQNNVD